MNYDNLNIKVNRILSTLQVSLKTLESQLEAANVKKRSLLDEQDLIERTRVALEQARPLLSASSIKQLEDLANTALSTIFGIEGEISYDIESKRFVITDDLKVVDLVESSGGGLVTALSFVFDLFLLVKRGCRKFLVYDEAFTAVSDAYYDNFMTFMRQACKDLGVDLLLVSHDVRLKPSMADTVYKIENGKSIKIK